jgi:hypothetical protein
MSGQFQHMSRCFPWQEMSERLFAARGGIDGAVFVGTDVRPTGGNVATGADAASSPESRLGERLREAIDRVEHLQGGVELALGGRRDEADHQAVRDDATARLDSLGDVGVTVVLLTAENSDQFHREVELTRGHLFACGLDVPHLGDVGSHAEVVLLRGETSLDAHGVDGICPRHGGGHATLDVLGDEALLVERDDVQVGSCSCGIGGQIDCLLGATGERVQINLGEQGIWLDAHGLHTSMYV